MRRKIVIIGATSAIAEHCARRWLQQSTDLHLVLVARHSGRLNGVADDLRVRSPDLQLDGRQVDFLDPVAIGELARDIVRTGAPDIVLIAHGTLPDQQQCQENLTACADALLINGQSAVLFAEAFAGPMEAADQGVIAVIGSVAGDRGRKSNYVYGSAKGLVTRYVQGLQHRFALNRSATRAILIKPGPTDTPMTAHLKQRGARLADVGAVADCIVQGIDRKRPVIYAPGKWQLVMMIIRHLPRFVFHRMDI